MLFRHAGCDQNRMAPVTHFSQLIVWKLAEEIRVKMFELTAKPLFAADFKAKSQGEDAANSVCRNIAEGFGCETHAEFARFLEISRRSLNEVHDVLHGALLKAYGLLPNLRQSGVSRIESIRRSVDCWRTCEALPRLDDQARRPAARTRITVAPTRIGDRTDECQNRTDKRQDRTDEDR